MIKIISETYMKQIGRIITLAFKKHGFYLFIGFISIGALLFSMSLILNNAMGEMLTMIVVDGDESILIQLQRTLIFTCHAISVVFYLISFMLGSYRTSLFSKMLRNYGVSIFARNFLSSFTRIAMISLTSVLFSMGMLGMSLNIFDNALFLVFAIIIQVPVSVFGIEFFVSFLKLCLSFLNETFLLILTILFFGYTGYRNFLDQSTWHYTSFMIQPNMIAFMILVFLIVAHLWVVSFKIDDQDGETFGLRARILPSNLWGIVVKETLRHREGRLNTNLMILLCVSIRIFKPKLLYDPIFCSVVLFLPCMQAIYTYSCFSLKRDLLKTMSLGLIYWHHFVAMSLVVLGHGLILVSISPDLISGINGIHILSSLFFLLVGNVFPLHPHKNGNTTVVIVVLMLAMLPTLLVCMEINRLLAFTNFELMVLGFLFMILMKGVLYKNLVRTLRR